MTSACGPAAEQHQASALYDEAARCRRLASSLGDVRTVRELTGMATAYEAKAQELRHA